MNEQLTKQEREGYDAAALCEPLDSSKPAEWQNGWQRYQDDMTRSETARWV